ncbi:MAG: endonuclease/exonuclease/phosphatase family protein, partial [Candidatus Cryptobacteroides sp.]
TFLERASALDNGTRNAGRYNPSHIMFNMMHPRALTLCDGYAEAVLDFRDYSLRSIGMPGQVGKGGKKGSEDGKSVRVMSFNGRYWNNNVDLENGWDHRKFAVVTMLEELCPDVVGTQELFLQQIEYVLKCCPQYRETGIVRDPNGRGGHDSGIFYNTDKVECLEEDSFHLSPTPRVPSLGWDAASCRTVTWVRLRHKASGKEFIVVNTHLDHKGPSAREKALDLILDSMDEINPGRLPLVLTGDFNAQYDEASLDRVKRELKDARYEALDSDDRYTFNGFGKSWTGTIDYIWEKGFRKCRRFRVVTKKYHHIPFISDHYPIYADLVIF